MSYKGKSLLELKRQQWARERAELSQIGEMFAHASAHRYERTSVRTFYSNVDLSQTGKNINYRPEIVQTNGSVGGGSYELLDSDKYPKNLKSFTAAKQRLRSPSLPSIRDKNSNPRPIANVRTDEDTSGYTSDNPHSPDIWYNDNSSIKQETIKNYKNYQNYDKSTKNYSQPDYQGNRVMTNGGDSMQSSYYTTGPVSPSTLSRDISTSSTFQTYNEPVDYYRTKEERAKWVDRNDSSWKGSADTINHNGSYKPGPGWLDRGIHELKDSEDERQSISHIRGQNAPLDPLILAERVSKRRKALEFQNAIKKQLEEREKQRQREYEIRMREERLEEERLMRQRQIEQARLEYEHQQQLEKEEALRKKQEMMKEALAKAEEEAKLERARRKRNKVQPLSIESSPVRPIHPTLPVEPEEKVIETDTLKTVDDVEPVIQKKVVVPLATSLPRPISPTINYQQTNTAEEDTIQTSQVEVFDEPQNSIEPPPQIPSQQTPPQPIPQSVDENLVIEPQPTIAQKQEETVLIGTPINLKKPVNTPINVNRTDVEENSKNSDVDGIALVLQPTRAMVPLPISNDIFALQNTIGNLQMATLLMQQSQLMSQFNVAQRRQDLNACSQDSDELASEASSYSHKYNSPEKKRKEPRQREDTPSNGTVKNQIHETCHLCGQCHFMSSEKHAVESTGESITEEPKISNEAENNSSNMKNDTKSAEANPTSSDKEEQLAVVVSSQPSVVVAEMRINSITCQDASTQTDIPITCEFCALNNNSYKVILKSEISATTAQSTKTPEFYTERENEIITTMTATTTATYRSRSKGKKQNDNMEERPKWGVNRPLVQYVKASERDPFYMRKKKKFLKAPRSNSVDSRLGHESDSASTKARNVCTEILPIKTDQNGKIFLNFREASTIMNEDEVKEKLRQRYYTFGKILAKRNWDDSNGAELIIRRVSNPDIENF